MVNVLNVILVLAAARTTFAENTDLQSLALKLVKLRQEIEMQIENQEKQQKIQTAEFEMLLHKRSQLQQQILDEKLRSAQIAEKLRVLSSKTVGQSKDPEYRVSKKWLKELNVWVEQSLPFSRQARMQALVKVKEDMDLKRPEPYLISRLWEFTEKEFRLAQTREFEITKIDLKGSNETAEVARLGMIHYVFKTAEGKVGYSRRIANQNWENHIVTDEDDRVAIFRLLDKARKKQTMGYFEVPGLSGGIL